VAQNHDASGGLEAIRGNMWDKISELWCKKMHSRAMWPIHGRYICPDCLREHVVDWEGQVRVGEQGDPALNSSMRSTVTIYQ
jgi:hypothetical protein